MWVFTIDGFYSAVEHRDQASDVMVRARAREDLVRMQKRAGTDLPISDTPDRDYPYRITVSKSTWAAYLAKAGEAIDYDNFKHAVGVRLGYKRASLYLDVWATMLGLREPKAGA